MISYDRIFESLNLATEMINGEKTDYTLFSSWKNSRKTRNDALGNIYVKYLDPIDLKEYLESLNKGSKLCTKTIEAAALRLSSHLMER